MQGNTRAQFKRKTSYSEKVRQRVLDRDCGLCVYCGFEADTIDHLIPYSFGGSDDEDNLCACCSYCNSKLSNKVFDTFEQKKQYLLDAYGKDMMIRIKRALRNMCICPDCGEIFRPRIDGASAVLCGSCYRKST